MKKICLFGLLTVFSTSVAYSQACPGGFWGNGQCIGACESPLVNPNVSLKFYGWSCYLGANRQICTDGGVFCYPEYSAYDMAYGGQYCGVIVDYGAGECTFPYLGLGQQAPKRRAPEEFLPLNWSTRLWHIDFNPARVTLWKKPITQVILRKNRFWWRHV